MHLFTWWSPRWLGWVDPSVVALAGGEELKSHPGFRVELFPRLAGDFFYPVPTSNALATITTAQPSANHIFLFQLIFWWTHGWLRSHLSSILLASCWRISAERLWYSNWAWTNAASWLTCSICNTHTHTNAHTVMEPHWARVCLGTAQHKSAALCFATTGSYMPMWIKLFVLMIIKQCV